MKEKILDTLKELLKYKTYDGNVSEFENIFKYIKSKVNKDLFIKEYVFNGYKNLVVSNTLEKELDIIFCGHIDVVPANSYEFSEDSENIYGRGTIDMKGGVAVMLELFNNVSTNKKIALFITSDEEIGGMCVEELLKIYKASLAIIPDGGKNFNLIYEEKGLFQLELSLKGISSHSSQPFNGDNAIVNLYNVYQKMLKKYPLPKSPNEYITSINLSMIEGGTAINQVPNYAIMKLDIRHVAKDKKEDFIKLIKKINKDVEIKVLLEGSVFETDLSNKNIIKYLEVCKDVLKEEVEIVGCESTSDGVYFSDLGIPTIIMNPVGYYPHCPNEYVNKESLEKLYFIYKKFLEESDFYV